MPLLSFGEIRLCHEIIWSLVESKTDYRKTVKVLLHFHQQHLVTVITKSICTELVHIKLYTIFLLLPFYFSLYFFFFVLFFSFPDRFFTHVFFSLPPPPQVSSQSHYCQRQGKLKGTDEIFLSVSHHMCIRISTALPTRLLGLQSTYSISSHS